MSCNIVGNKKITKNAPMVENITWLYILKKPEDGCLLRNILSKSFDINLHFSSQNLDYVAAYKYNCQDKSTDDL